MVLLLMGIATGHAERIIYASTSSQYSDECDGEIWMVTAEGSTPIQLTDGPGGKCAPAWAPDGRRIAYVWHDTVLTTWEIRTVTDDLAVETLVSAGVPSDIRSLAWSPDGTEIAIAVSHGAERGLWILSIEDSVLRKLSSESVARASWAIDGQSIAYDVGFDLSHNSAWTINADGTGARLLMTGAASPAYAPDGRTIAMTVFGFDSAPISVTDPTNPSFFDYLLGTDQINRVSSHASWSPQADRLVYQVDWGSHTSLYVVATEGHARARLLTQGRQPAWSPERDGNPGSPPEPIVAFTSEMYAGAQADQVIVLDALFNDADAHGLMYSFRSHNPSILELSEDSGQLYVSGVLPGETTIVIAATDPTGAVAELQVPAAVAGYPGDFDYNGVVDDQDFFDFADHFGTARISPNFDVMYDLTGPRGSPDGIIDYDDFFSFADCFGPFRRRVTPLPGPGGRPGDDKPCG